MTDPLTLTVAGAAAVVSLVVGWLSLASSPSLDAEPLFKTVLTQLLLGEVEAEGGDSDAWVARVLDQVPYHPVGRYPEKKVTNTGLAGALAYLPGEAALIEKLKGLPDVEARWAWMYREDEAGLAARFDDPVERLGPAYDPSQRLGGALGWPAVVGWGRGEEGVPEALGRLATRRALRWALVDGRGDNRVLAALDALLPGAQRFPWPEGPVAEALSIQQDALEDVLAQWMDDPSARFVLAGESSGVQTLLRLMNAKAALRDRVLAVVSIGGTLQGSADAEGPLSPASLEDWMGAHFTHHELDTEMARQTPYFCMQWLDVAADPPGGHGLEVWQARFPPPRSEALTQEYVDVRDLGVLYTDTDPDLVARGLWLTVGMWTAG
jgi:hypothetical protein